MFDKYVKNDGVSEQRRDRSPRMTLGEMGLNQIAVKDPKEERKLKTLAAPDLPDTTTPTDIGERIPARLVLYSTLNPSNALAAPNGEDISNETLPKSVEHGEREITFDQSEKALNILGSHQTIVG